MNAWHDKSLGETLSQLQTHRHRGLSDGEAKTRLDRYGPNELKGKPPRSLALRLLDQNPPSPPANWSPET